MSSEVLTILENNPSKVFSVKDLAKKLDKKTDNTSKIINRLNKKGLLNYKKARGKIPSEVSYKSSQVKSESQVK